MATAVSSGSPASGAIPPHGSVTVVVTMAPAASSVVSTPSFVAASSSGKYISGSWTFRVCYLNFKFSDWSWRVGHG